MPKRVGYKTNPSNEPVAYYILRNALSNRDLRDLPWNTIHVNERR